MPKHAENKSQWNLSMPRKLKAALDEVAFSYGKYDRWMLGAAAVLLLLELSDAERDRLVQAVAGADVRDAYEPMIAAAKLKRLGLDPTSLPAPPPPPGEGTANGQGNTARTRSRTRRPAR